MNPHEHSTVVGVFSDTESARQAIEGLKDAGFEARDIGILMRDRDQAKELEAETGSDAASGAATGAIGGGILGGLAGWLVGIGALAIPGVGPFIAAGAFGTALAGAGIGAGIGAVAGALVNMGVPEEEANWYADEVKSGNTLVTVKADGRYSEVHDILREYGAYDVHDRSSASMAAGRTTGEHGTMERATGERGIVELREEELRARRERVQTGEVGVRKEVVSEEQSIDVPTTREDVYVERRPVDRPSDRPVGEDESFRMPVHEERVVPEKETVVSEEISMGKRPVEETQRVSDTVRREEARIEKEGDFEIVGGESHPQHEHRFVNDRCEVCGAVRQYRRAA